MLSPIVMEEDLETKKRKATTSEATKATITSHFPVKLKLSPSSPILKEGKYSNPIQEAKDNDNKDKVCAGLVLSFLHLMIDISLDRDYMERHRLVLTRLISAIK